MAKKGRNVRVLTLANELGNVAFILIIEPMTKIIKLSTRVHNKTEDQWTGVI